MKRRHSWILLLPLALLVNAACGKKNDAARAQTLVKQGNRLIETSPGQSQWIHIQDIPGLSRNLHLQGKCPGFVDITASALAATASGAPDPDALSPLLFSVRPIQQRERVDALLSQVSAERMALIVQELSAFPTRNAFSASGRRAMELIRARFADYGKGRADVTVELFEHQYCGEYLPWLRERLDRGATENGPKPSAELACQPSVIARIAGHGAHASEKVIIGGHGDSITESQQPLARAPGADDNASGTATVLEAFRVVAESGLRPDRTLEFIVYAGEEYGLLGSAEIADAYATRKEKVIAALQFDMTMHAGSGPVPHFIGDYVNTDLTAFVTKIAESYQGFSAGRSECGYACSDHASWTRANYPSAFPFESTFDDYNHRIHSADDLFQYLDAAFGAKFAKIAVAYAFELGIEPAPPASRVRVD